MRVEEPFLRHGQPVPMRFWKYEKAGSVNHSINKKADFQESAF